MQPTPEQQAILDFGGSATVSAGAGTGKTALIAFAYHRWLVIHGLSPLNIVAVTYTDKAAAEQRARIRQQFPTDRPDWSAEVEAAPICTLHALCARICRTHPDAAGVSPAFGILDDVGRATWAEQHLTDALCNLPPEWFGGEVGLPFGVARQALRLLLEDPVSAREAFGRCVGPWEQIGPRWAELQAACDAVLAAGEEAGQLARLSATVAESAWAEAARALEDVEPEQLDAKLRPFYAPVVAGLTAVRAAVAGEAPLAAARAALEGVNLGAAPRKLAVQDQVVLDSLRAIKNGVTAALKADKRPSLDAADERLHGKLQTLAAMFEAVAQRLEKAKRLAGVLDFADLEVHALRALEHEEVRRYYGERWRAFILDEAQDTNRVQARVLAALIAAAEAPGPLVLMVGDLKQSIYSFRRAEPAVATQLAQRITEQLAGRAFGLTASRRSHGALVATVNRVSEAMLGALHEELGAHRTVAPHAGPHVKLAVVEPPEDQPDIPKRKRQWAEARYIAEWIAQQMSAGLPVHDRDTDQVRPLELRDIAIISRTWAPLEQYQEALAAVGLASAHAGGASLLATREARDGQVLIRWLAEPSDNLALAAVLRAPWGGLSDPELQRLADIAGGDAWWPALCACPPGERERPVHWLSELLAATATRTPAELLNLADGRRGYTSTISNLDGGERRLADWSAFVDLARDFHHVFEFARWLADVERLEVELPRPALEAGQAVSLLTIHHAKGLEWPVVIVPDLAREPSQRSPAVWFDPDLGVGLKLDPAKGETEPVLTALLRARRVARERDELGRVLYVALTRARDQVLLTATGRHGRTPRTPLDMLRKGLEAAGVAVTPIPYDETLATPPAPLDPPLPPLPASVDVEPLGPALYELPVGALTLYDHCPRAFEYRFVDGHPGLEEGGGTYAQRVGTLAHWALETGRRVLDVLQRQDPLLPPAQVQAALKMVRSFDLDSAFAAVRHADDAKEVPVRLERGGLTLLGRIDRLSADDGPDGYVLDYKTGTRVAPVRYRLQLAAYAAETGRRWAYLADLPGARLITFGPAELAEATSRMDAILAEIVGGRFAPTPSVDACAHCGYRRLCPDGSTLLEHTP